MDKCRKKHRANDIVLTQWAQRLVSLVDRNCAEGSRKKSTADSNFFFCQAVSLWCYKRKSAFRFFCRLWQNTYLFFLLFTNGHHYNVRFNSGKARSHWKAFMEEGHCFTTIGSSTYRWRSSPQVFKAKVLNFTVFVPWLMSPWSIQYIILPSHPGHDRGP